VGFSRQFTGGFEEVADARQFVAATLLRDSELYEAARLLVDEAITLDRGGARPASVAGRSLELFDALALDWDSSAAPDRRGHVVWFELEA
jgi:hypothetical protein